MDNQRKCHLQQFVVLCASIILTATATLVASSYEEPEPLPYHTSILTGEGWVLLLSGHLGRICYKLGVSPHVFAELISELREMGHTNSKHVSLEEQLAIFLYCCITGLSIRHVGERFQRSNETRPRFV